ncbi:MAG: PEP-CTERM sorting domain-containing protein [Cyanobacteria bacterium J06628_3]
MTTTIKKIRNYALLGTIISASAAAPAHASSPTNINSNNLTGNPLSEASKASKDINSETEVPLVGCISSPESEPCNQLAKEENQDFSNSPLFREANNIIESVEAAQTTKVKVVKGDTYTVYNLESNQSEQEELPVTIYASASVEKEKVPEPSALLGLIALFALAKKRKMATNSDVSAE